MSADSYAWMESALCAQADPDEWAEPRGSGQIPKRICNRCPARPDCEAHADRLHAFEGLAVSGIWGGRSKQQRDKQRRQMGEAA
jgi:WhiB family redox-sensing transcriptional regulator